MTGSHSRPVRDVGLLWIVSFVVDRISLRFSCLGNFDLKMVTNIGAAFNVVIWCYCGVDSVGQIVEELQVRGHAKFIGVN
jgi:hypothetical protein